MRSYLVTGSASGIGLATRQLLEQRGDRVVGVDLKDAEIELDLADPAQRGTLAERLGALDVDHLDGVVPSAGVGGSSAPAETIVRLNYFGAIDTVSQVAPLLARSQAARICMVSSIMALQAPRGETLDDALAAGEESACKAFANESGVATYCLTKRALTRWVRTNAVAEAWLGNRILINAVAPGVTATGMTAQVRADPARLARALETTRHPLGIGDPHDVAAAIGFLVGAENRFVVGQIIFVDGGHEALTCGPERPRDR